MSRKRLPWNTVVLVEYLWKTTLEYGGTVGIWVENHPEKLLNHWIKGEKLPWNTVELLECWYYV